MQKLFNATKKLIPFLITLTILFILLKKISPVEIFLLLKKSQFSIITLALSIFLFNLFFSILRWSYLLSLIGYKIRLKKLSFLFLAGVPIAKILPSNSGEFIRAFYLKDDVPANKNASIILIEAMLDFLILSVLALVGGIFLKIKIAIIASSIVILSMIALSFLAIKFQNKKICQNKILKILEPANLILKQPKKLIKITLITLLLWFLIIIVIKLLFTALGVDIPLLLVITIQPIVIFIGLLPITFSGIGVRESAMLIFYSELTSKTIILSVGILYSFFAAIVLPLLCFPFMYKVFKNKKLWKKNI